MTRIDGKRVLLGVSGGIAAYKAPAVVRALRKAGAEVRVVLTSGGARFVSALALEVVSENRVGTDLFEPGFEHDVGHIELARWADVAIVAPATANLLARMRQGMADDLLTTLLLATTAPIGVFPAMNTQMWRNAAVQENVATLRERGVAVIDPDSGELACKEVGPGRMPDPDVIAAAAERLVPHGLLSGVCVCVSAGPTREHFDPVRFLSNPSSGRMGYAIAAAASAHGADVTLVSGPTTLDTPLGCRRVDVESAEQMAAAVLGQRCDLLIMSAAVADWRPAETTADKRKKQDGSWTPELVRTTDILQALAGSAERPSVVVGFAAETTDVLANARAKLQRKGLDGIVANDVSTGRVFGTDENRVIFVPKAGDAREFGPASKRAVAEELIAWSASMLEGTG